MCLPKPWVTLSSCTVLDDRWLKLRADDCMTAEGKTVSPYYVVEAPDFVTIAAVTDAGALVMVRQYRHGSGRIHLELPAGIIDAADADPLAAAARELKKETGYEATSFTPLAVWHVSPPRGTNRQNLVLARGARLTSAQSLDEDESITVELLPLDRALDAVTSGAINSTQHVAAVLRVLVELEKG
jgi:8-oxo-dGTP pyrophosphatase MutT (NUDIX family)